MFVFLSLNSIKGQSVKLIKTCLKCFTHVIDKEFFWETQFTFVSSWTCVIRLFSCFPVFTFIKGKGQNVLKYDKPINQESKKYYHHCHKKKDFFGLGQESQWLLFVEFFEPITWMAISTYRLNGSMGKFSEN